MMGIGELRALTFLPLFAINFDFNTNNYMWQFFPSIIMPRWSEPAACISALTIQANIASGIVG